MAVAINRSWCSDRRFYSNLITNIKSHKPDGEVGVRNIREGLSRWVSRELQGPLTGHTWFLTSSAQLVADIKTVVAEDSDYFVKLDVRDFYITGTPSELKDSIKVLLPLVPVAGCCAKLLSIFCPVSMLCLTWFGDVFFMLFVDQAWAIAIPGALGKEKLQQDHRCSRVPESSDTIATEMMF